MSPSQPKDLPVTKEELYSFENEFANLLDWDFWEASTKLEKSRWYRALKEYFE